MTDQSSRFENALTLACAAITMLFCGQIAEGQLDGFGAASSRVPCLREEFADTLDRRWYSDRLFPVVCPDIEPPYQCGTFRAARRRLDVLLHITLSPSIMLARVNEAAEFPPGRRIAKSEMALQRELSRHIGYELGVDPTHVRYVWQTEADLDPLWAALRRELEKMRAERGAQ